MGQLSSKRRNRVFLSYATEDRLLAKRIAGELEKAGVDVWYTERELFPGDSIYDKIGKTVSSSDYIFLLLSKNSVKHKWVNSERSMAFLNELTTRDVSIIPVLIDDCEVPNYLSKFQMLDFRKHTNRSIGRLINQILSAPRIDFSSLSSYEFLRLTSDLLEKLKFRIVESEHKAEERGIDLIAEYIQKDPFGVENKETWIVEIKFYRSERASLRSLRELADSLLEFPKAKALIITNGLLTSYSKKWLRGFQEVRAVRARRYLRVIEGPELRNLLVRFPDIVDRYFPAINQRGD